MRNDRDTRYTIHDTRYTIHDSGFTLIELILYFAIFGIVATLGVSVFSYALKGRTTVRKLGEVQVNVQRATDQIVEKVHTSLTINDASSTLSLKMSDSAKDPTIFALSSGAITIQEGTSTAVAITPDTIVVTSLTFTKITNPSPATSSVQIKMTAGYNVAGSADPGTAYSIQTTAMPLQ